MRIATATEAVFSGRLSLAAISKKYQPVVTEMFVTSIINDLTKQFNIGKNMTGDQMALCAELICKEYYFLNPSEIKYVFNGAIMNKYGKVYDRLDTPLIMEWFANYMDERMDICITKNEIENTENKKLDAKPIEKDAMAEIYQKLKENATEAPKEAKKEKERAEVVRDQFQDWIEEFDAIYKKSPVAGDGKFIEIEGKKLDINQYLEYKLKEKGDNF